MKLSAPVYHLKRKAKLLSRQDNIPLHAALNRIALEEGFSAWSLLMATVLPTAAAARLYASLSKGDLLLVAARPGHGKTLMSIELAIEAMRAGNRSIFFTLVDTEQQVADRFRALGFDMAAFANRFEIDSSNAINAGHVVERLATASRGTLAVIDYLQLLDQKRENPDLMVQVRALKSFAQERGLVMVFLSQVDRAYEASTRPCPDLNDIRLPNPLDLGLFTKACFLNNGAVEFRSVN